MTSSMRWKHATNALGIGKTTFSDMPQTDSTMNCKSILLNAGLNNPREVHNLMNNKACWVFVNKENNIQSIHSLVLTTEGYIGILRDELDSSQRVLLGRVTALTSCFISIGNKDVATTGNQQFLDDPGNQRIEGCWWSFISIYYTTSTGNEQGSGLTGRRCSKDVPFELGENIPSGHSLKDPLPNVSLYPDGFAAWFAALCWAFTKNNKKPITGIDGGIFNNTN